MFFLPVIRAIGLATGGFPVFLVVSLYLLLLLNCFPGALSGMALLKVLFIRLSVSTIKKKKKSKQSRYKSQCNPCSEDKVTEPELTKRDEKDAELETRSWEEDEWILLKDTQLRFETGKIQIIKKTENDAFNCRTKGSNIFFFFP